MSEDLILKEEMHISIAYRLMDRDGNPIDQFTAEEPYKFVLGFGQILPVVEEALYGKKVGESFQLAVGCEDAYGEYIDKLVTKVEKDHFANEYSIRVGMRFSTTGPDGNDVIVEVIEVGDHHVILDGNHPLAGVDLIFEIDIVAARPASETELEEARRNRPKVHLH